MEAEIIRVTDLKDSAGYGILSIPGLVVDEDVVSYGKVLKPGAILEILEKRKAL